MGPCGVGGGLWPRGAETCTGGQAAGTFWGGLGTPGLRVATAECGMILLLEDPPVATVPVAPASPPIPLTPRGPHSQPAAHVGGCRVPVQPGL